MLKYVYLNGLIGEDITLNDFKNLKENEAIVLTSPGGSVYEAFSIYNYVKSKKKKPKLLLSGFVMSAASYITMAFDEISAYDNVVFMIHNARGLVGGDKVDLKKEVELLQQIDSSIISAYESKLNISRDELQIAMDQETIYNKKQLEELGLLTNDSVSEQAEIAGENIEEVKATNKQIKERLEMSDKEINIDSQKTTEGVELSNKEIENKVEKPQEIIGEPKKEMSKNIDIMAFSDCAPKAVLSAIKNSKGFDPENFADQVKKEISESFEEKNAINIPVNMEDTADIKAESKSILQIIGYNNK